MRTRLCTLALGLALTTTFACDSAPAPKQANAPTPAPAPAPAPEVKTAKAPEPAPETDTAPEPAPVPEPVPEPPAEVAPDEAAPTDEGAPTDEVATAPAEDGAWKPPAGITDPRDPALIPPGTPAANASAFKRLAVAKGDKPPVGGIGANGIHLDELEVGKDWEKSRCADVGNDFVVEDQKVNVCMRVIHPRGEAEELTIFWSRNGQLNQRSKVAVSDIHAYLTRGFLPITEARKGEWTAEIKTADGAVLGKVNFTVK